jgi:hypothetical protein
MEPFDRNRLHLKPLAERKSKTDLFSIINPDDKPPRVSRRDFSRLEQIASLIKKSKENNSPIVFASGAHLIKNGLSAVMIKLMEMGYVSHILGNGAFAIHDWEFAFQCKTEEDVKEYMTQGQFGLWDETGKYINGAINDYPYDGYGTRIGKLITEEQLRGEKVPHPYKKISVLGNAYRLGIPVSISLLIGGDITHTHPECDGRALGQASHIDFLKFAETISNFEGGTYISIGSAVTSPMVFEKAISIAKNAAKNENRKVENFNIVVNDIQEGKWDWKKGEPDKSNPAYYLRFMKSFSRVGGNVQYIQMDNRAFLHNLYHLLK